MVYAVAGTVGYLISIVYSLEQDLYFSSAALVTETFTLPILLVESPKVIFPVVESIEAPMSFSSIV